MEEQRIAKTHKLVVNNRKPAAAPVRKDWTGFVEYRNKAANVKMLWMLKALI